MLEMGEGWGCAGAVGRQPPCPRAAAGRQHSAKSATPSRPRPTSISCISSALSASGSASRLLMMGAICCSGGIISIGSASPVDSWLTTLAGAAPAAATAGRGWLLLLSQGAVLLPVAVPVLIAPAVNVMGKERGLMGLLRASRVKGLRSRPHAAAAAAVPAGGCAGVVNRPAPGGDMTLARSASATISALRRSFSSKSRTCGVGGGVGDEAR